MDKQRVYFNEYNILMDNAIYLPLVSGLLQSYSKTISAIQQNYRFMPFIFIRDIPDNIIKKYKNPAVAVFSVSMWNMNLSLEVARVVKKKYPHCLIVFGGPSAPFNAERFFRLYPFIDVAARGEGEQVFAKILLRFLESRNFKNIPGISYRDYKTSLCVRNKEEQQLPKNLDIYPSPYLEGAYEYLFEKNINFQAIIETNRGCPYVCSYCFWGQGGLSKVFRFFSLERIKKIAEWCGTHKIKYVFCADSNFGIFKRDLEIASYFTTVKYKFGFPDKFRVCYAKTAEDTVYEIGKLLHRCEMEKGITLSRQTDSRLAAYNVGRKNINIKIYENLQKKYNKENISVYTELILGLPGETYESFRDGIERIFQTGIKNQVFVYFCQIYPNTELADLDYQKKFEISALKIPLSEIHGVVRAASSINEYEEIIIATISMNISNWKKSAVLSWLAQLLHGLKLGFYVLIYMAGRHLVKYTDFLEYIMSLKTDSKTSSLLKNEVTNFYSVLDSILQGNPRGQIMRDFGNIYWDVEEASYLRIISKKEKFYKEMQSVIIDFLGKKSIKYEKKEMKDVIEYQKAIIPNYKPVRKKRHSFSYNIPEYFDKFFSDDSVPIIKKRQVMILTENKNYEGSKKTFAKEIVIYGRKSNKMVNKTEWFDYKEEEHAYA